MALHGVKFFFVFPPIIFEKAGSFASNWKGTFARLFTIIRGVIWNYFNLGELLKSCGIASKPIRVIMQPQQLYLPLFTP
jgi:hypothetical protein